MTATSEAGHVIRTAAYRPELNVLCGVADYGTQTGPPVARHLEVEVMLSRSTGAGQ
jgi:hypothetical protein